MEFKYAQYVDTPNPRLYIECGIGQDGSGAPCVVGTEFADELRILDQMGKDSIDIYINSPGGDCQEGMTIVSAILNCRTVVNTYNTFISASTAGWVFLCGKNRYAFDYSAVLVHAPYVEGHATDNDLKALEVIHNSIATIISNKTGLPIAEVKEFMTTDTWFDAEESLRLGFATEVIDTTDLESGDDSQAVLALRELEPAEMGAVNAWKKSTRFLNAGRYIKIEEAPKASKKEKQDLQMNKNLAKALGLPEDATEEQVLKAVNKLNKKSGSKFRNDDEECDPDEEEEEDPEMDAVKKKMDKFGKAIDDCQGKMSDLADKHKDLMEEHKSLQAAHDEFGKVFTDLGKRVSDLEKSKEDDDSSMTYDAAAVELVNRFVHRIGNDASKILDWTKKAKTDMKKTEAELEALPINMKSLAVEAQIAVVKDRDTRPTMNMSPAALAEWYSANARKKAAAKK